MFDIGFQEVVLIGLIGLVVVGPARLPKLAKTVGLYVNKMRRFVTDVRSDVERELHAEDLRQSLSGNSEFDELKNVVNEARAGLDEVRSTVDSTREEFAQVASAPTDWSNPDVESTTTADSDGAAAAGTEVEPSAGASSESNLAVANTDSPESRSPTSLDAADDDDELQGFNTKSAAKRAPDSAFVPSDVAVTDSAAPDLTAQGVATESEAAAASDDDEDEPTVINAKLAAKREAGGKPD